MDNSTLPSSTMAELPQLFAAAPNTTAALAASLIKIPQVEFTVENMTAQETNQQFFSSTENESPVFILAEISETLYFPSL